MTMTCIEITDLRSTADKRNGVRRELASYTDWAGEHVAVEYRAEPHDHDIDGPAVTISESEYGGTYTVAEAVEMLEHIQAPAELIEWVRG